jgi:hypothetical protein
MEGTIRRLVGVRDEAFAKLISNTDTTEQWLQGGRCLILAVKQDYFMELC